MDITVAAANRVEAFRPLTELVSLARVHKVYGGGDSGVYALQDIELQIRPAEFVAVCGPGGSGKTSLLHIVGMLECATEGSVVLANLLISKLSEQARADLRMDLIGFVFQSFSLLPVLSARENVLLPLLLRTRLGSGVLASAEARADALLAQLGLSTQANHYPPRLDPSQVQRVGIARALITRPRLVIADEPTSRLDSNAIRLVMDLFAQEQDDNGTAFLVATRDQRQLSRANRTLQLSEGRLSCTPATAPRQPLRFPL